MKKFKKEIGDLTIEKGKVIPINEQFEAVLTGSAWYNNTIFAAKFPVGESPKANNNVDWRQLGEDVKITARGGSYGNQMFNCVLEIL